MQDIHDIRPPVQVGFDPMLLKIMLMVVGGILILTLLFFLIRKYLKKRQHPKGLKYLPAPLAPYDAALKELDLLFQRQILDPRVFYFNLTAVLKKYVGCSFNMNALEMTSQEFIRSINRSDIDKEVKKEIARFFKVSDAFKYAGIIPEKNRAKEDLLFIKEIIQQIEKDQRKLKDQIKLKEKEEETP